MPAAATSSRASPPSAIRSHSKSSTFIAAPRAGSVTRSRSRATSARTTAPRITGSVTASPIATVSRGGCASSRARREAGFRGIGTDIGGALENAKKNGLEAYGSLDEVRAKGPFDVVTMWHTLEHFTDPKHTLEEVRSVLAKDGTLIVAVPDAAGLQASLFRGRWFHLDVPRHLYHFSQDALTSLLGRVGFSVTRWHHQELELDVFGWMQSALNAVLPVPNVLFQALTGKPSHGGKAELALSYALGTALAPAALAATAVGTVTKRGGTLIAIAKPAS